MKVRFLNHGGEGGIRACDHASIALKPGHFIPVYAEKGENGEIYPIEVESMPALDSTCVYVSVPPLTVGNMSIENIRTELTIKKTAKKTDRIKMKGGNKKS